MNQSKSLMSFMSLVVLGSAMCTAGGGCATPDKVTTFRETRARPVNMELAWRDKEPVNRFGSYATTVTRTVELIAVAVQPWAAVAVIAIEGGGLLADKATDAQVGVTEVNVPGSRRLRAEYDERGMLKSIEVTDSLPEIGQ